MAGLDGGSHMSLRGLARHWIRPSLSIANSEDLVSENLVYSLLHSDLDESPLHLDIPLALVPSISPYVDIPSRDCSARSLPAPQPCPSVLS
jgi:hypothetical protein